jgi:hypothetical protein
MSEYNYTRPIILTEVSMLYAGSGEPFETAQGEYVSFIHENVIRLGLQGYIWFTLPDSGWYHSGLMEGMRCKPACEGFGNYGD